MGFYCTAFANVTFLANDHVRVITCLDHYGHETPSRLRLPEFLRAEILSHVQNDRDLDWILQNCNFH